MLKAGQGAYIAKGVIEVFKSSYGRQTCSSNWDFSSLNLTVFLDRTRVLMEVL